MHSKRKKLIIIGIVAGALLTLIINFYINYQSNISDVLNIKSTKEYSFYCKSGTTREWKKHKSYGLPEIRGSSIIFINSNGRQTIILHNVPCILRITSGDL